MTNDDLKICVVGLGYVGLPLALEFGKIYKTIGFDINNNIISSYLRNNDPTGEIEENEFISSKYVTFSSDQEDVRGCNIYIIAVPTPIDIAKKPDFSYLIAASTLVAMYISVGSIIVYESTVYPGATEEICIPILEKYSGLKWLRDFNVGYSPERVNPGDKNRTITKIVKVVSGDTKVTVRKLAEIYSSIIDAGVHIASSIKVAEAAKVIENTQRDLNIALINELAIIFNKFGIDTTSVLEAAKTKWNFLPFVPGLVGGHCIGVDPYYLTYKAEMEGYHPQVILSGRRINDSMHVFVAQETIKLMVKSNIDISKSRINVLGVTFKENCSDIRNSRVADLIHELEDYGCCVNVHDPLACPEDTKNEYNIILKSWASLPKSEVIILAVPHQFYLNLSSDQILNKVDSNGVVVDIKSVCNFDLNRYKELKIWRL